MSGHVDVQATTENRLKNPDPMGEHCPNSLLISGKTQKNNNKRNNRIAANNILYRLNFIAILLQKTVVQASHYMRVDGQYCTCAIKTFYQVSLSSVIP